MTLSTPKGIKVITYSQGRERAGDSDSRSVKGQPVNKTVLAFLLPDSTFSVILQTSVSWPAEEMGQLAGFWIALVRMAGRAFAVDLS